MTRIRILSASICICVAAVAVSGAPARQEIIKRFAMVVGSNNGGPDRVTLRYAVSDAVSMMEVLRKLGGVEPENSVLLIEPGKDRFIASLADMRKMVIDAKKAFARVELIFYYSGHSDEEGILLGGGKVLYRDIKQSVVSVPAGVRIAILDSCSSGAFTSIKGGRNRSPFLADRSRFMEGFAFMTSSSSDEASQESDRIKGSFFTHYLITGLRGAADLAGDGRITLNEAYQFAYTETLSRTEKTLRGAQHPNYHIMMSGAGDVVLTDIRKSSCTLVLSEPIYGRIFLRDGKNSLVAELNKNPGRPVTLGLESGRYTVLNERSGELFEAKVLLQDRSRQTLSYSAFAVVDREYARSRGDEADDAGGGNEKNRTESSDEKIRTRGFIDSTVRISLYGGIGVMMGGIADKERRYYNALKRDLAAAYFHFKGYGIYTTLIQLGPEIDLMFPALKFAGKPGFAFTGIKFGVKARYGYGIFQNSIVNSESSNSPMTGNSFMAKGMEYHYWAAGPMASLALSPRNKIIDVLLSLYVTGGQVFSGKLSGGSALRDAPFLWLRMGGGYGTPLLKMDNTTLLIQSGRFNSTRVRGYTLRGGFGPEICLNKWLPLILGLRVTYAYTNLTLAKSLPVYFDRNTKTSHHELGGEVSLGVHF